MRPDFHQMELSPAILLAWILLAFPIMTMAEEPVIPAKPGFEKYEALSNMALFTVPKDEAPAEVAVKTPPFADDLEVTSVASIAGTDFVGLRAKSEDVRWLLAVGEPSPNGVKVISVEWGRDGQLPKVQLSKGVEFASLELSSTHLTSGPIQTAGQTGVPPGMPAPPNARPQPPGGVTAPGRPPNTNRGNAGDRPRSPQRRIILPPSQNAGGR